MTKETPLKNSEVLNESSPVMIVIEDSSFYGKIHQRYLKDLGVETVILHGIGNFDERIAEIKNRKYRWRHYRWPSWQLGKRLSGFN